MIRLMLCVMLLAGCVTETEHGKCVGAFSGRDPRLVYETSWWNVGLGIVFFELIIPPLYVASTATMCPEGVRAAGDGR